MHKTADVHSNLLVSWELVTKGYQGRPMKCTYFTHFNEIKRPLPGIVICWLEQLKLFHFIILFFRLNMNFFPLACSCCGAGTAADTEMTTQMISSQLELHRLNTGRIPRLCTANRLLKQYLFRYFLL